MADEYTYSDRLAFEAERELAAREDAFIAEQERKAASGESYGCPIHFQTTDGCSYCAAIIEIHRK